MLVFTLLAVGCLAGANLWVVLRIVRGAGMIRFVHVESLAQIRPAGFAAPKRFKSWIEGEAWAGLDTDCERHLAALQWTRNHVSRVDAHAPRDPVALLDHVLAGGGALCGDMSKLFLHVLAAVGVEARELKLARNIYDPWDVHSTVEVWHEGRWIVIDPTFGISLADDSGRWLSAQEVKSALLKSGTDRIKVIQHGPASYPPRWDRYYVDPRILFNNVFVPVSGRLGRVPGFIPPLRFFLGERLLFERLAQESISHLVVSNTITFFLTVLLPGITLLMAILVGAVLFS